MNTTRPCGCKAYRTCLICEEEYKITTKKPDIVTDKTYVYCPYCKKAWPGWDINEYKQHPDHFGEPLEYPGVYIKLDFLTKTEESELIKHIDASEWNTSQSGRRKQNFGPKCNFRKNKMKEGNFNGFPKFSRFVQEKFRDVHILQNFLTVEQCFLEYTPERGAAIDPHIDDCWIWGERIVTVNLLSDSVLTMTYNQAFDRYNLDLVETYPSTFNNGAPYKVTPFRRSKSYPIVRIPMPARSLLVLFNAARYDWEHQIVREDIVKRRVCIAYREFTPVYLPNGTKWNEGAGIIEKAKNFFD